MRFLGRGNLLAEAVSSGPQTYRLIWHTVTADAGALCEKEFPRAKTLPADVRNKVKSWAVPWDKEPTCADCRRLTGLPLL